MQPEIRRLGILRLSAIGDVIHALPMAHGLRRTFPQAHITWVIQPGPGRLLEGHPAVDSTLLFPRRRGPAAWLRFVRRLRACNFDAVVDPQGNAKSGALALLSGARLRCGLHSRDCKEPINALASNRRGPRAGGVHGVDRAWAAAAPLGVQPGADVWGLQATEEELAAWRERCLGVGVDPDGRLLAVHLTRPEDPRSWFLEPLAETLRAARADGWQVILNGRAERRDWAAELKQRAGPGLGDLCGEDDLRGLLAQFQSMGARRGNVLLAPDSGPMHLAVAAGLPVVCLSGPQDPARTGPRSGGLVIKAWEGLECAPCIERKCIRRPPDRACMAAISAPAVLRGLREASHHARR